MTRKRNARDASRPEPTPTHPANPAPPAPPAPPASPPKPAASLDDELHEILFGYVRDAETSLAKARTRLRDEILPALKKHRVATIEAAYSGYGDSGAIEGVQFRDSRGRRVERSDIPGSLKEQLAEALYELLPEGFELNEGSQGTLTIDLHGSRISVQHQENYTATSESSREFTL